MELRQLRHFVRVVELGSMGRAAAELGIVTSTLSQQISRLEGELSTRLLQRLSTGVVPTEAGLALFQRAQLILRQVEGAMTIAQRGRLSGNVSVGLAQTTASMVAVPYLRAMRKRYPDVHLRIIEGLSGSLSALLNSRQVDLAVLFDAEAARRWSVIPLLHERLFLVGRTDLPGMPVKGPVSLERMGALPLILPSSSHTLRALVLAASRRARIELNVVAEIDGLGSLLDAVRAGLGASVQPGSVIERLRDERVSVLPMADGQLVRTSLLVSLSDDELTPAGLAARVVLAEVSRRLVEGNAWTGASLAAAQAAPGQAG